MPLALIKWYFKQGYQYHSYRSSVVKRWSYDPAMLGSVPAGSRDLFRSKRSFIAHSPSLSPSHQRDIDENC